MRDKNLKFSKEEVKKLNSIGFDTKEEGRCGSFVQIDNKANYASCQNKNIEIMPTSKALKKYSWLKNYLWRAVDKNKDEYTKEVARYKQEGYFIRAKKGSKNDVPVQACLYIKTKNIHQKVHNIIIAEENSSLNIVTGCAISPQIHSGLHIGVSEFFVKKGASISFTMIHNWAKETIVRPRTGIFIEKDGKFVSNYICLQQVKDLQMYPMAYLRGEGAVCYLNSILFAREGTFLDVGSGIILEAQKTKGEILSRTVSDGGKIIARGKIIGRAPKTKAHLECRGIILNKNSEIIAIPEIDAQVQDTNLFHEAAIGKIAEEEIEYLMARGFSRKEAISMIVRGFLSSKIIGLNEFLKREIKKLSNIDSGL